MLGRRLIDSYFHRQEEAAAQEDEEFKNAGTFAYGGGDAYSHIQFHTLMELQNWANTAMSNPLEFFSSSDNLGSFELHKNRLTFRSCDAASQLDEIVTIKTFGEGKAPEKAVIIVPHWNARVDGYDAIARVLAFCGYYVFILTLPHHGSRSALPNERVANRFLSANLYATIMAIRQSVSDVRSVVNWLHLTTANEIHLVGVSLGSCVASLATAFEPRISSSSLLLTAGDFAEVVWNGRATQHIRAQFEGKLELAELKKVWAILSPSSYLERFRTSAVPLFVVSGRRDEVVPFDESSRFVHELRKAGVPVEWKVLACGHYTLATFPFSWLSLASVIKFLSITGRGETNSSRRIV